MKNPPIFQVTDFRKVADTSGRPGSQVAVCLIMHEGMSWVVELSGVMAILVADELAQQAARCMKSTPQTIVDGQSSFGGKS